MLNYQQLREPLWHSCQSSAHLCAIIGLTQTLSKFLLSQEFTTDPNFLIPGCLFLFPEEIGIVHHSPMPVVLFLLFTCIRYLSVHNPPKIFHLYYTINKEMAALVPFFSIFWKKVLKIMSAYKWVGLMLCVSWKGIVMNNLKITQRNTCTSFLLVLQ